jgi:hypothetical protein
MRKLTLVLAVLSVLSLGLSSAEAGARCCAKQATNCPKTERVEKQECKADDKKPCDKEGKQDCPERKECQKACPKG